MVSELRKPQGNANVRMWLASVREVDVYVSVLVLGEIRRGIQRLRLRDPAQAVVFETWLETVYRAYADHLVPITAEAAEEWGRMNAVATVPTIDGLMAATARVRGWTFVTRNTTDVDRTGVRLVNPFEPLN